MGRYMQAASMFSLLTRNNGQRAARYDDFEVMHLYQFLLLFSFFLYKRAQLVYAWGQNWVYTWRIVCPPGYFKAFIQHIFDYIVCGVFGAWTLYSLPKCVKPVLASVLLCRALRFLWLLCWYQMPVELQHVAGAASWWGDPERVFGMNHSLPSIKNRDQCRWCSWIVSSMWSLNLSGSLVSGMNWSLFQALWGKEWMNGFHQKQWPK